MADLDKYSRKCECGWLKNAVGDPHWPIGFDEEMNEYYLKLTGEFEGRAPINYCPSCGGDAPMSHRPSFFEVITVEEQIRLTALAQDVVTRADVVAKFGPPDEEISGGSWKTAPGIYWSAPEFPMRKNLPERTVVVDVMRYQNLSRAAVVDFLVNPHDRISFSYFPKSVRAGEG